MSAPPIMETRDLTIKFGGHLAVDSVSLQVEPFSVKSIIGPNGAGKTTLFNLISGQLKPTGGRVFFKGSDITGPWTGPTNDTGDRPIFSAYQYLPEANRA